MINTIPDSWTYCEDLENLLYFYQCSEELLSNTSPDSFRIPACNSLSLCSEIRGIYQFLYSRNQIDRYYSKYIPCIVDELIHSIHNDSILKKALGLRLQSVVTGLTTAKEDPKKLNVWLDAIRQTCTLEAHVEICKENIIALINDGNSKKELTWYTQNLYIDLLSAGYSSEFLYQTVVRFFDNKSSKISEKSAINAFLNRFDMEEHEYEFYVVADTFKMDNLSRINPQITKSFSIQELSEATIRDLMRTNGSLRKFCSTYEEQKQRNSTIKMLSCKAKEMDPYCAFHDISRIFDLAQCFDGYFKHRTERKTFFDILLVGDGFFMPIKPRRVIPSRPYIDQATIDHRIEVILQGDHCSIDVILSVLTAIEMHLDALNCKNASTMLRSFWTALEALFFNAGDAAETESAKYCLISIIQKTYLLKQFRFIYDQLIIAIPTSSFWEDNHITCMEEFVKFFMMTTADSDDFKQITKELTTNPLLRSRIYNFRKELSDGKHIKKKIDAHREKVSWHIDRIYRTRNLSTHAGIEMPYTDEILFNIHNYFDYVINYIICKLETKIYIPHIASIIFEAKNDNNIHLEYLKTITDINEENYLNALFGPDCNIISYDFESLIAVPQTE